MNKDWNLRKEYAVDYLCNKAIERRNLAPFPSFSSDISSFAQEFNEYYSDHFGFRELLTKLYFKIENKINKSASFDDVTIGKDGWMFLGGVKPGYIEYGDPIGDAIHVNLYSDKELEVFAKNIAQLNRWLKNKGIDYFFIVAPNKHTIYFDKMPDYIVRQNPYSAMDQLLAYLYKYTDVNVIDLRPALNGLKNKYQLYYKTDTHWNYMGANVAQFEIMKRIEKEFPGLLEPYLLSDHEFKNLNFSEGDLARFAGLEIEEDNPYPVFKNSCKQHNEETDKEAAIVYTTICENQQLRLIVFRDSFFKALQPYFSRKFNSVTYIPGKISYQKLTKYIDQYQPDIVIEEVIERELPYIASP
ncbi:alginate O-acetyltransferase AlgX-related protein [methane-oxidizing endosymbiont of Gigantopelta aegis]|uniref:alginate O-acetyltransferase AlgX-related protein n=1 Tax=methane-oxidizing endosymbiont of Gigantopelta aegis TaxID=2794938 RepID=UPI0018DE4268|nr:hypothetical protein [methane-oxidizing endosymbiont of Gigantopelta aegis]